MKNKTDIQTKNQQIDKILQEQYNAETKILESALLNVAGKISWDEFPEESEEKIRAGYNRLITRLRETGDFNEAARAEKTGSTRAAKEKLESLEYDGNRTHRILKSAAAAVAVVMLTALVGMTAIADYRYPDKNTQTYQNPTNRKRKKKKIKISNKTRNLLLEIQKKYHILKMLFLLNGVKNTNALLITMITSS